MAQEELKIAGMKLMIEGGAQFTADLNTAKTTSKMLTSELKLLEAGTTSAGKNGMEFLRAKSEALTSKLAQQEAQTKITKIALDEASTAAEVDAKQVQRLEDAVTKSRIEEEKLKVELINVSAQMDKATNAALIHATAQKEMGEKMEKAGKQISGVGDGLTKYVTAPALAAAAALAALAVKTIESADKIQLAADKYGLTTDRVQELTYAGKGLDVEFDTMVSSQSKLIKAMTAANDGTEAQRDAFKKLGVEIVNSDGSFRDSNVVWGEVIDKLGQMPNETEASSTAMILLGKSAMELNPLIRAGSGELAKLTEEAHKNGAVMSGENVAALDKFGDSVEMAKVSIGTAAGEITVKMLPTLNKLLPIVQKDVVPAIGEFAETVGNLIAGFDDLDPAAKIVVETLAGLAVVAGPLLKITGTGITLAGSITTARAMQAIATANLAKEEVVATATGTALAATLGPILLVIGAFAGTAAIYELLGTESRAATSAVTDVTDAMIASNDAYSKTVTDADTSAAATKNMTDKLYDLAEVENKSNTQKAQMKSLVSSLNSALPDLSLTYDEQTDSLSKNKDAVYDLIDAKMAQLKSAAYENQITKAYEDQITQADLWAKAQDRYNKASAKITTIMNPIDAAKATAEFYASADALEAVAAAGDSTEAALKSAEDGYANIAITAAGTADTVTEATGQTAADLEAQAAAVQKSAEDQQAIVDQYYSDLEQSEKDHQAEMGSLETFGIERSKLTAAELKKNRDKQVKDYQDWRAGLKLIAQKVPEDVLAELEELGPTYDQVIDDLANMSPEQIADWVESWRAPAEEAAKAAKEEMGEIPKYAAGAIISTTAEFQKTALTEEAARAAGRKATAAYLAGLKETPAGSKSDYFARMTAAFAAGKIPAYDVGTKYVPYDQLALIHKGEAVIPAAENPYNAAVSLGTEATNRAMASRNVSSNVVNNATTDASVSVSLSGAVFNVRSQSDIGAIATQLAAKVAASRKAVGA